jgi:ankyrin repeat protein
MYLIACGSDVMKADSDGRTPLHVAATAGRPALTNLFIESSGSAQEKDRRGRTPVHMAAVSGSVDVCGRLLEVRGSIDAVDCEGGTPLHFAVANRKLALVKLLLEKEACPDALDNEKVAPLGLATKQGYADVCAELLRGGASVNCGEGSLDFSAVKPETLASEHADVQGDFGDTLRLLVRYGADLPPKAMKLFQTWLLRKEVILHSLKTVDLNGLSGKILRGESDGRLSIDVVGHGGKRIKSENIALKNRTCFPGDRVVCLDRGENELYGKMGSVLQNSSEDTLSVDLEGLGERTLKSVMFAPTLARVRDPEVFPTQS